MGQKVHPVGIRLGITKEWSSRWYANSQTFPDYVEQDHRIREFLRKKLKEASISRIHIERPAKKARTKANSTSAPLLFQTRRPARKKPATARGVRAMSVTPSGSSRR